MWSRKRRTAFVSIFMIPIRSGRWLADLKAEEIGRVYVPGTPEVYSYDFDGNITGDGRWLYTWDSENRLIAMDSIAAAPPEQHEFWVPRDRIKEVSERDRRLAVRVPGDAVSNRESRRIPISSHPASRRDASLRRLVPKMSGARRDSSTRERQAIYRIYLSSGYRADKSLNR